MAGESTDKNIDICPLSKVGNESLTGHLFHVAVAGNVGVVLGEHRPAGSIDLDLPGDLEAGAAEPLFQSTDA